MRLGCASLRFGRCQPQKTGFPFRHSAHPVPHQMLFTDRSSCTFTSSEEESPRTPRGSQRRGTRSRTRGRGGRAVFGEAGALDLITIIQEQLAARLDGSRRYQGAPFPVEDALAVRAAPAGVVDSTKTFVDVSNTLKLDGVRPPEAPRGLEPPPRNSCSSPSIRTLHIARSSPSSDTSTTSPNRPATASSSNPTDTRHLSPLCASLMESAPPDLGFHVIVQP